MSTTLESPKTEERAASLLSGQFRFILQATSVTIIETLLEEINGFVEIARRLETVWGRKVQSLSQTRIRKLSKRISDLQRQKKNDEARRALKEELNRHHIPNDL